MTETETSAAPATATTPEVAPPVKDKKEKKSPAKKEKKPKKAPEHPKYSDMITEGIKGMNERSGTSRQALIKYIVANYKVDESKAANQVRLALKRLTSAGTLKQVKGAGASGSFKLAESDDVKPAAAKAKATKNAKAPKNPAVKQAPKSTPKKSRSRKKSPKKAAGGKKGKKGAK